MGTMNEKKIEVELRKLSVNDAIQMYEEAKRALEKAKEERDAREEE